MKKYKLTQNIGLKIMALLFAVLLWLIVVNVDDPVDSAVYTNIPVTVVNEDVVTNMGKVYQIAGDTQTVRVTVYAKRSVLSKISSSNIIATADLSQMDVNTYLVPITATVQGFETKYQSAVANPTNLQVSIEDRTKNTFPVSVGYTGTVRDGYVVGEMTANPENITIGGADSIIANIDKVEASVNVSGLSSSCTLDAELILYDGNGNVMDQSQLTNNLGEEGISVNVEILNTKTVDLDFAVSGTPASGYIYTGWSSVPETVRICGSKSALAKVTSIQVPASEIDISGASGRQEFTIDITPYLPEGVQLVDAAASNVVVTVGVEQEGVKTIELSVESIKVNNLSDELKIEFQTQSELKLQFTGAEELLEVLDIRNAASIDLRNYTKPGVYEVEVNIQTAEGVSLTETPTVKIELTEKIEE